MEPDMDKQVLPVNHTDALNQRSQSESEPQYLLIPDNFIMGSKTQTKTK